MLNPSYTASLSKDGAIIDASAYGTAQPIQEGELSNIHGFGVADAPRLGIADDWTSRLPRGREALYRNAIEGFTGKTGVMPPKGGFTELSDEQVREIVDFMVESVR